MLVRTFHGKLVEIKRCDYITNTDYYNKLFITKFNRTPQKKNAQVKNIISTILYG